MIRDRNRIRKSKKQLRNDILLLESENIMLKKEIEKYRVQEVPNNLRKIYNICAEK
jgi:hypothetical protein